MPQKVRPGDERSSIRSIHPIQAFVPSTDFGIWNACAAALTLHRPDTPVELNAAARRLFGDSGPGDLLDGDDGSTRIEAERLPWRRCDDTGQRVEASYFADMGAARRALLCVAEPLSPGPGVLCTWTDAGAKGQAYTRITVDERKDAIASLAAAMGHDLNNPLTALVAQTEFLTEGLRVLLEESPSIGGRARARELAEAVEDGRTAVDQLRALARDLRIFVPREPRSQRSADLVRVFETVKRVTSSYLRHRMAVQLDFAHTRQALCDEATLAAAFFGLFVELGRRLPEHGHAPFSLTVRTAEAGQEISVEILTNLPRAGRAVMLERLEMLPFSGKAADLPVRAEAMCARMVEDLGGRLEVVRPTDAAADIHGWRARLPALLEVRPRSPTGDPFSGVRRGRVLVIDDEPSVGTVMRRILSLEHDVTVLVRADDALVLLTQGAQFDVIFCDMMMPEMTGTDFHEALEAVRPDLVDRVVFISGGAMTERTRRFLDDERRARLDKPFDLEAVRLLVASRLRAAPG